MNNQKKDQLEKNLERVMETIFINEKLMGINRQLTEARQDVS